jgi:hypothetical protein
LISWVVGREDIVKKSIMNYWIDVVIAIAFVISSISGLVFLLPVGWGTSVDGTRIVGLPYSLWDQLHIWGSLAMVIGVGAHLILHAKWILTMSRCLLGDRASSRAVDADAATNGANPRRRRFLRLGWTAVGGGALLAACGGLIAALVDTVGTDAEGEGAKLLTGSESKDQIDKALDGDVGFSAAVERGQAGTQPAEATDTPTPTQEQDAVVAPATSATATSTATPEPTPTSEPAEELCVRCPRGLVNDPYPGRCHRYVDKDADGLCDYSIPEPCG